MSSVIQRRFAESPCSGPKAVPEGWRMPAVANVEKILAQYLRNQIQEN